MSFFRSNCAMWAVRFALFALFLRAAAPSEPVFAVSGEQSDGLRAFPICSSYIAKLKSDGSSVPSQHGKLNDCAMCLANPIASAAVFATLVADNLAPNLLLQSIGTAPRDTASSKFSPKTRPARAPPTLRAA
jgi:hypothetical protein